MPAGTSFRLHALTPVLRTCGIPGSIAFYTHALGFAPDAGGAEEGWAATGSKSCSRSPTREGDDVPAFPGSLYLRT